MKSLGTWLYRYMAIHMHQILDALTPCPMYRPVPQRVRTSVSPSVNDIRLRSDFLMPWI